MDGLNDFLQNVPTAGWLVGLTTLLAVGALLVRGLKSAVHGLRYVYKVTVSLSEFLSDWQEVRDAHLPARLARLEVRVKSVEAELQANGGKSLRDQTNRIEKSLREHIAASGDHR